MKGGDREWPIMQSREWPGWNQDSCFWKSVLASLLHPGQWKEFLWDNRAQGSTHRVSVVVRVCSRS